MNDEPSGGFTVSESGLTYVDGDRTWRLEFTSSAALTMYFLPRDGRASVYEGVTDFIVKSAQRYDYRVGDILDHPCQRFTIRRHDVDVILKMYVTYSLIEIWIDEIRT